MNRLSTCFVFILFSMVISGCNQNGLDRVFTRSDFVEGGRDHPIYHYGQVNNWLAKRGGDTLFSLFMAPERLALMPRPQILVFNDKGELLEEMCAANFSSEKEVLESIEQKDGQPIKNRENLFELLDSAFVNGDVIKERIPDKVDRFVLIPWSQIDTAKDQTINITPYEEWIVPVMAQAGRSSMNVLLLWEAIALTDMHTVTVDEFSNIRFEAFKAKYPENFIEDEELIGE